jgi:outer membrane protein assembly factor BamD (BamD/ComL family)
LQELGKSSETAFAIRQLAKLQAYYLHKPDEAKIGLEELLNMPRLMPSVIGQIKLELGDTYVLADEVWDAALVYGQVEKQFPNEVLGQEAKVRNAKLAYYKGDFAWAKIQLDVLKGATSQLMANDALNLSLLMSDNLQNEADTSALKKYAYADLLIFKNLPDQALAVLDSINIVYPKNSLADDILMAKAKIYIAKNKYPDAIAQLQKMMIDYPTDIWADDAVFMMADIYETKLNNLDKAKELYQKMITDFPGSLYVIEARKRFRNLRGDKLQ